MRISPTFLHRGGSSRKNTENGVETSFLSSPTKKIHKIENSQKNSKKNNTQKKEKLISYRGKGRKNRRINEFKIVLVNMRGFKSKEASLLKMIKKVKPSTVVMNKTLLSGRAKVSVSPYTCWSRNRKETGGGGIATAVSPQYKDFTIGAGEGEGDDEYLITRIECFSPALNIINCYGEQRKTGKEEVEGKFMRLRKEMEAI